MLLLEKMQKDMFNTALEFQKANTRSTDNYDEFRQIMEELGGFIEAHWCGNQDCEEKIKDDTKATIRNIPFNQKPEKGHCLICNGESNGRVIFAKAY